MKSNETRTRALVLGGGGVAGVAWELGILRGLHDTGVDVRGADVIIGTSAGSVVGAQIASGTDLESLIGNCYRTEPAGPDNPTTLGTGWPHTGM